MSPSRNGARALLPVATMIASFFGFALLNGGFSQVPLLLVFLLAAVTAVAATRHQSFSQRITCFSRGAGSSGMLLMVWIFMLAGAFAASAKAIGAVEATVGLTLRILPEGFALPGMFLAACLVSLCMGTSVGTIVALTPVASSLADCTGIDVRLFAAAVAGGSFFGDNLSFISDTTIMATRTQGCELKDKFRVNIRIVLPAAVAAFVLYAFLGNPGAGIVQTEDVAWWKALPYIFVLVAAAGGMNVLAVLAGGCVLTGLAGLFGGVSAAEWTESLTAGITGMSELILISMLAGGVFEMIHAGGGIVYVIRALTLRIHSRKGAELGIVAMTGFANICTANNTVAILSTGNIAANIASRYGIDRRKSASLLDTASCCVQGMLPYGAQLLMAGKLAGVAPTEIIPYLYYPMFVGVMTLFSIGAGYPRKFSR
ncbi:MAG: Na+/H+ antiporter NhaC family protein [Prevotellaceae bacterium]|nr:Na+/H+ antiporter NhaC family protein [Prevotellaceae bacterium]